METTQTVKILGRFLVADPKVCHGQPTFRGTRIFVADVLEQVARGLDWETIIEEWHGSITHEAIAEAVHLAAQALLKHSETIPLAHFDIRHEAARRAAANTLQLEPSCLEICLLAVVATSTEEARLVVSFFRNDCGDTIELPGDLSYPDLNLGPLGDSIFSRPVNSPMVSFRDTLAAVRPLFGRVPTISLLTTAPLLMSGNKPAWGPVWISISTTGEYGHLAVTSATTNSLLLFTPFHLSFALPVAALIDPLTIKFIVLAVIFAAWWWWAPMGWGAAVAALGVVIDIIAILIEIYLIKKAAPPAGGGVVPPGGGPLQPPSTPYDRVLQKAKDLQKWAKERQSRTLPDPLSDDYQKLAEEMEELRRLIEQADRMAGATPEEKEKLNDAQKKANDLIEKLKPK